MTKEQKLEFEKIFDKNAKEIMEMWNLKGFKRGYKSLWKVILKSVKEFKEI